MMAPKKVPQLMVPSFLLSALSADLEMQGRPFLDFRLDLLLS